MTQGAVFDGEIAGGNFPASCVARDHGVSMVIAPTLKSLAEAA
jgi:hypothetical protein